MEFVATNYKRLKNIIIKKDVGTCSAGKQTGEGGTTTHSAGKTCPAKFFWSLQNLPRAFRGDKTKSCRCLICVCCCKRTSSPILQRQTLSRATSALLPMTTSQETDDVDGISLSSLHNKSRATTSGSNPFISSGFKDSL